MEEWKFICDSKFYQISNLGNVRCMGGKILRNDGKPYTINKRILKQFKTKCGYMIVDFKLDINKKYSIHRLVLEMFYPVKNMENLQVNHIDGDKTNNTLTNLEWTTRTENMQHAMKHGLFNPQSRCGEKHPMCKLTHKDVEQIRIMIKDNKMTQHAIAKMYNVSDTTISEIKTGRTRNIN